MSNFAWWWYSLSFTYPYHFQWNKLYFKVTAVSNNLNWKLCSYLIKLKLCLIIDYVRWWWWLIPHRWGFWEGWWSVCACLLVVVESNSWSAHLTALQIGKGLGWGRLGFCRLFLPPAYLLCGFMLVCLKLTTGFSHCWVPAVSVWGLRLPWLMADARLCKLSLQLVFVTLSWSSMIMLSILELAEEDCFGHASSILETWPAQHSCTWSKMDSMLDRLAFLRTSSFDT